MRAGRGLTALVLLAVGRGHLRDDREGYFHGQRKSWSSQKAVRQMQERQWEIRPGWEEVLRTRGSGQNTNIVCYKVSLLHPRAETVDSVGLRTARQKPHCSCQEHGLTRLDLEASPEQ